MPRRVTVCSINWGCPYRTDLCKTECTGERKPRDAYLIVDGNQCFIRQGTITSNPRSRMRQNNS